VGGRASQLFPLPRPAPAPPSSPQPASRSPWLVTVSSRKPSHVSIPAT
jgi:hypothetical protein